MNLHPQDDPKLFGPYGEHLLALLHEVKSHPLLDEYFEQLRVGAPVWDEETFIIGIRKYAEITGHQRLNYFQDEWGGLCYPGHLDGLWRQVCEEKNISQKPEDFRWQCPVSWTYEHDGNAFHLVHCGKSICQDLNALLRGPTVIDCGMYCQLLIWSAIRYLMGDDLFHRWFTTSEIRFYITQRWNREGPGGNLLSCLYDEAGESSPSRVQSEIIHNHSTYVHKHPGGTGRLQNVTRVDGEWLLFDPNASQRTYSRIEIEQKLLASYNRPTDHFDKEMMAFWAAHPGKSHPSFKPLTFGDMHRNALESQEATIKVTELRQDQVNLRSKRTCMSFNFERLRGYLETATSNDPPLDFLALAQDEYARSCEADRRRKEEIIRKLLSSMTKTSMAAPTACESLGQT